MYYEWGFNGSSSSKNLRGPNIYIYLYKIALLFFSLRACIRFTHVHSALCTYIGFYVNGGILKNTIPSYNSRTAWTNFVYCARDIQPLQTRSILIHRSVNGGGSTISVESSVNEPCAWIVILIHFKMKDLRRIHRPEHDVARETIRLKANLEAD